LFIADSFAVGQFVSDKPNSCRSISNPPIQEIAARHFR